MKNKKRMVLVVIAACLVAAASIVGITVYAGTDSNTIYKGVYISTVDVGGMTREEAKKALSQYLKDAGNTRLTVLVNENEVTVPLAEFELDADLEEPIDTALALGKSGNLIKRYKEIKDLEKEDFVIPLPITVERRRIEDFVQEKCTVYDIPAQNATMTREDGTFQIFDEKSGRKVATDQTVTRIEELFTSWPLETTQLEAVVVEDVPTYTSEVLSNCTDILGTFSTTYASSSSSRANNLSNGARLLDGSIIWPGETFSTGKTLQPITADNGYSFASAYENGQVVDSIGGGVCQVATTLYNAALQAEIEIAERSNHSMIVGYVKPSMDAAIAGDYKDLKLTNNTDSPIYIEAKTVGRTITFTIYGKESRALGHRTVKYESKVLEVIQPGPEKVTEDETKPETYRRVTQSAHVGYKAELWKVVYEDGAEISREMVNTSSYAATPAYVTVGTKKVSEEKTDGADKKDEKDKENDKETGVTGEGGGKPSASMPPTESLPEEEDTKNPDEIAEE